jgi:hypothetical protein
MSRTTFYKDYVAELRDFGDYIFMTISGIFIAISEDIMFIAIIISVKILCLYIMFIAIIL